MTGFASGTGTYAGTKVAKEDRFTWVWDMRAVNARGLDIKMRVPDWIEGLDAALKPLVTKYVSRGNISVNFRISREEIDGALEVDLEALDRTLNTLKEVEARAERMGVDLEKSSVIDVMQAKGVQSTLRDVADIPALKAAIVADFKPVLDAFLAMRGDEGQALQHILTEQVNEIERLTYAAQNFLATRGDEMANAFRRALDRAIQNASDIDSDRVAAEIAILAVKTDVTEEIDRLHAHVKAARDLISAAGPHGRKLDFLMQEFNREANTLCSKSQNADLTRIGLDLKAVIDQMREQVQNVE
ncbi:MAG: YicC/YloC family endoribonuclease [Halocynthiibacter sp.]